MITRRSSVPIRCQNSATNPAGVQNTNRQRAALAKMDEAQRLCGLTRSELDAEQARLRAEAKERMR